MVSENWSSPDLVEEPGACRSVGVHKAPLAPLVSPVDGIKIRHNRMMKRRISRTVTQVLAGCLAVAALFTIASAMPSWQSGYDQVGLPGYSVSPRFAPDKRPICYWVRKGRQWGMMTHQGRPVTELRFSEVKMEYPDSLWAAAKDQTGWHLLDTVAGQEVAVFDELDTPSSREPFLWVKRNGRCGLFDLSKRRPAVPLQFFQIGLEVYVGEVGWTTSPTVTDSQGRLVQLTGYSDEKGQWGLIDLQGKIVSPAQFEGIFYDGYYFSGNLNPRTGMEACRLQAKANHQDIFAFARRRDCAVGYFDRRGTYFPLHTESPQN